MENTYYLVVHSPLETALRLGLLFLVMLVPGSLIFWVTRKFGVQKGVFVSLFCLGLLILWLWLIYYPLFQFMQDRQAPFLSPKIVADTFSYVLVVLAVYLAISFIAIGLGTRRRKQRIPPSTP